MMKSGRVAILTRLGRFLSAPIFTDDEDKTRQAGLLNTVLLAWMAGSVIMTAAMPFMGLGTAAWLAIALSLDAMVVGLWFMVRRGLVRLASVLLASVLGAFFTFLTYAFGGVSEPSYPGYIAVVLIAGLLLGGPAAVVCALVGILVGLVLLGVEANGLLPSPLMPLSPLLAWLAGSMNLVLAATILYLATDSVNNALERLRCNERALGESNRELQREIGERQRAEQELQLAHDELEVRVQERTAALAQANAALHLEVAERKRAEEMVRASLQEKEVLLKEIHHRVKNNLQIISSLLSLQSVYTDDEQMLAMFVESQNRIRSMALVHERLYQSSNLGQIEFGGYIRQLSRQLLITYQPTLGQVELKVDAQPGVALPIDEAVTCGLILNELVSNALKHAFPDGRPGEVCVAVSMEDGERVILKVSDDGVGFPEAFDFRNTESLGMQLVNTLVHQLDGTVELDRQGGTALQIEFAIPPRDVRHAAER